MSRDLESIAFELRWLLVLNDDLKTVTLRLLDAAQPLSGTSVDLVSLAEAAPRGSLDSIERVAATVKKALGEITEITEMLNRIGDLIGGRIIVLDREVAGKDPPEPS